MQLRLKLGSRPLRGVNDILAEDRPVHAWYNFVLSFPPHLVRHYAERFELSSGSVVLDPFCGTGTTPVECKKLGIHSVGIEAIPVIHFASSTKTDWDVDPDELVADAECIAEAASAILREEGFDQSWGTRPPGVKLRTLSADQEKLLISGSISAIPLHKTLVLLDAMEERGAERYRDHERLALASVLPTEIGNLRFGPEVGVGTRREDCAVVETWLGEVHAMARDLRLVASTNAAPSRVIHGDARVATELLPAESVDAVITSPPYPNEKDYTRIVRLESVLLGFMTDRQELRETKEALLRSNTRNVYKDDEDDQWVVEHESVQEIAEAIERRRKELNKDSGFERTYSRVTKLYFGGIARHLSALRELLRPGAQLAYVVGDQASYLRVMIRTGQLIGEIAEALGYELIDVDLFRTRMATATKQQLREEVVLLRWCP